MGAIEALPASNGGGVYLDAYLAPLKPWLSCEAVTEILVNRPGEIWVEAAGTGMSRYDLPALDDRHLQRLAEQIARISHQGVNRERPLLSAVLPDGARVQFVAPSATRAHWGMAIRRHRLVDLPLSAYDHGPLSSDTERAPMPDPQTDPVGFLSRAVRERLTILISGGTSSGKTTFLNALLREVPADERIVLIEDTPEIRLRHANGLGLVAVKGELGEARVGTDDLLQAALRLRPDRIVVGELRGRETVSFLRAINTGHPGSFSTIHASSPAGALEQLVLMVMQAGLGLGRQDTLAYARSMIDVIVQLGRSDGRRGITAIEWIARERP
ncbi:P-type DNA transfer ATPase VirB11 [Sphingomonas sp. CGMCC 1.13654]|uniref:Type IV secretion system protein n=1 Tax=Sphingomonas chungangi TaxID=2683589 RepID=A0A838L0I8_9SPHN|nr:P-type DNA transfer ATPase VirB11 [Sphingomonas chungangi]MBA2932557.1 P-type DNA transfer ATPase VirB11 [Sphingomonas chungangi]MVW56180.1 P-type DNA transfer ATPase VirB11 [Sphingomonas chungangi]